MRALSTLCLCVVLAGPVSGDPFPALYDVTGVASNDVLNIRAEPTARAPILDRFGPFDRDVEVLGTDASGKWGRVHAGERMGWSSLRFLTRQPDQDGGLLPEQLFCHGTEPFWNLDFQADHTTELDRLGSDPLQYDMTPLAMAQNAPNTHGAIGSGPQGAITLGITRQMCSDGMSDLEFGLSATVIYESTFGADVLSGCCSLR